ncbi:hypothetical protein SteCoe_10604 [Stentor coeruleus]|uniref:PKD/REJ-like domain-containing protein n=1 Tax=Stentor coeruleus TaxID=5963 RepID=A0A1R2CF00_9CILI|nr:hypothetical protein SteCoe_10604 [Stentor coeruleus]
MVSMLLCLLALGQSKYLSLNSFSSTSNSVSFQVSLHNSDTSLITDSGILISAYLIPSKSFINSNYQIFTNSGTASGTLYPTLGTFNLILCSMNYEDSISELFTITSSISQLTLVLSLSLDQVVIGQVLIVTYEILENDNPLNESKDFIISEILNQKIDIVSIETLGYGYGKITIAFSESGKKIIIGLSENLGCASEIQVVETSAKSLNINLSKPYPSTPTEDFGFTVFVYTDENLSVLVSENFVIYVNIDCEGVLTGTTIGVTNNGKIIFSGLSVKSSGTYILTINGIGNTITPINLESFSVAAIESIHVSFNDDFLYVDTDYIVYIYLYNLDGLLYNYMSQIYFINVNLLISGNTNFTTSNGIVCSSITCLEPGLLEVVVTSDQKSSQLQDFKFNIYCVSSLCSQFDTNTGMCLKCAELAEKNNGKCLCKENTIEKEGKCNCINGYTIEKEGKCNCINGYTRYIDSCKECYNKFYNNEVISYYNEDYKSISIVFSESVSNETIFYSCKSLFSLPKILQLYFTSCFWLDNATLVINFSTFLKGQGFFINLSSNITPFITRCIIPDNTFQTEIQTIFPYPIPEIDLIAPKKFSLPCAYENIRIYNLKHNSDYVYNWNYNTSYSSESAIEQSYEYFIMINSLDKGKINVTAQVKSLLYETLVSQSIVIEITDDMKLPIEFNMKNMTTLMRSEPISLKAEVLSKCGDLNFYFCKWNFSDSFYDAFDKPIFQALRSDIVYIDPGILTGGEIYGFYVNCTTDNYWGYEEIYIKIEKSPLEIKLDRASGIISQHEDLVITTFVNDPDIFISTAEILWTCESSEIICYDINYKPLNFNETASVLFIPKETLQDRTSYTFRVVASANTKSAYAEITLIVDSKAYGMATITSIDYKYSNKGEVILLGKTSGVPEAKYQWNIYPKVEDFKTNKPYIRIPCNILNPNTNYTIYFTMTSANSSDISSYVKISTPIAPVCTSFDLFPFNTKLWSFSASDCYSDARVYHQFGIINDFENTIWLTPTDLRNTALVYIPSNTKKITMRACSNNICTVYTKSIITNPCRNLDILNDILTELIWVNVIPSGIIYYGELVEVQEQWDALFKKMQYYFLSEPFSEGFIELFLSCLTAIMNKKEFVIESNIGYFIEMIIQVLLVHDKTITTDEMGILMPIIDKLADVANINYISQLLNILNNFWISDKFPESNPFVYSNNLVVISSRLSSVSLKSYVSPLDSIVLSIPPTINVDEHTIYDLLFVKYPQQKTTFQLMLFESGTFFNDSLQLYYHNIINIESINISVTLPGKFDIKSKYSCSYRTVTEIWIEDLCSISDIEENNITVLIYNQTLYEIYKQLFKSSNSCKTGYSPVIVGSLLIFFLLLFLITDSRHNYKERSDRKRMCLSFYPLVSIFLKYEKTKEFKMVLQLFFPQLLLLCVIGILDTVMIDSDEITDNQYENFKIKNVVPGIIAFITTQSLTILIYYINIIRENSTCINFGVQSSMGLAIAITFIATSIMNNEFCNTFSTFWTLNYLIFAACTLIIEIFYAIVARHFIEQRIMIINSAKVQDYSSDIDSLNIK